MKLGFLLLCCLLFAEIVRADELQPPISDSVKSKKINLPDISLNVPIASGNTILNIGFITNYPRLNGLSLNVLSGFFSEQMNGVQMATLLSVNSAPSNGIQISGLGNFVENRMNGFQFSYLQNYAKEMIGMQVCALLNIAGGKSKAVSVSGLGNFWGSNSTGCQITGLMNYINGDSYSAQFAGFLNTNRNSLYGVQMSSVLNVAGELHGVQVVGVHNMVGKLVSGVQAAGAVNIASQTNRALQLAGLLNLTVNKMNGAQIAITNIAGELNGVQVGIYNLATETDKGVQVGLVNYSSDTTAKEYGLVNISPITKFQLMIFGGNANKSNLAMRFLNKYGYSIVGVGTHYRGLNEKFSGSLYYRIGLHKLIGTKFRMTGDIGAFHIENFENEDADTPERMYSLQGRLGVEYYIGRHWAIMLDGGYGFTRYYEENKKYENKPIIELGVVLF